MITISNLVTLSHIVKPFDLSLLLRDKTFELTDYAFARIPIRYTQTKFSIFKSGTVVSRGSKSRDIFEMNLLRLHDFLAKYALSLDLEYTITNIVASAKLFLPRLNLSALAGYIPSSSYDRTIFTGESEGYGCDTIVYSLSKTKPKKTILIFPTSSITLTGFRSLPDLAENAVKFKAQLKTIIDNHPEVLVGGDK